MGKPRADWLQIHSEYVTALQPVTLTDLAAKYGLARGTVNLRAVKEGWKLERDLHIARTAAQTTEKLEGIISDEGAQFDKDMFYRIKNLLTRFDTDTKGAVDPKYPDVFKALMSAQVVGKAALGDKGDDSSVTVFMVELQKATIER